MNCIVGERHVYLHGEKVFITSRRILMTGVDVLVCGGIIDLGSNNSAEGIRVMRVR